MTSHRHTWPPLGATACGGKRYTKTLDQGVETMRNCDEPLNALYRGAGTVLLTLVHHHAHKALFTHVPPVLDELRCPLCATDAPMRSFLWDGSTLAHLPWAEDVAEVVLPVLTQLRMDAHEVVVAVALIEKLAQNYGAVVQARSARPIFLAACVLALKLTTDDRVTTRECYDAVAGYFTGLSPLLLARAEEQLLELLNWRFPNDPDLYNGYARSLARVGLRDSTALHTMLVPTLYPV